MKKYILKLLKDDIQYIENNIAHSKKNIEKGGQFLEYFEKQLKSQTDKLKTITRYYERVEKEL